MQSQALESSKAEIQYQSITPFPHQYHRNFTSNVYYYPPYTVAKKFERLRFFGGC